MRDEDEMKQCNVNANVADIAVAVHRIDVQGTTSICNKIETIVLRDEFKANSKIDAFDDDVFSKCFKELQWIKPFSTDTKQYIIFELMLKRMIQVFHVKS